MNGDLVTGERMPGQSKVEAKLARAEIRAKAATERRNAMEEVRTRRSQQLDSARAALDRIEDSLRTNRKQFASNGALVSHLEGFYEEIDKLAKGKSLVEATDLAVEQCNHIVRDAKALVKDDVHLDRMKEFVPAGNNPLYPDVLITIRSVQQSLKRFEAGMKQRLEHLEGRRNEARTIQVALELILSEDGTEEDDTVTKTAVEKVLRGSPSTKWLDGTFSDGYYFSISRLDQTSIDKYFAIDLEQPAPDEQEEDD